MAADSGEMVVFDRKKRRAELEEKIKKAEGELEAAKKELRQFRFDECGHPNKRPFLPSPTSDLIDSAFSGLMICPDCGHEWFPWGM